MIYFSMKKLVQPLLAWYAENARVLPWRSNPSPYRVWISEIMLQQTRVDTVIPYYERFLNELPDVESLAKVPEERLLKLWEGLGYYSRARNLQKAAQMIAGKEFPSSFEDIRKLPGAGEYTAGAIASIAFGLPEPAVDGNVLRILCRVEGCRKDIADPKLKTEFREKLRAVYPSGQCGDFTQALMELGATVCYPNGAPDCQRCPWKEFCYTSHHDCWKEIPVKRAAKARREENRIVQLAVCGTKVALRKRPSKGLLADLWEFPNVLEGEPLPIDGKTIPGTIRGKHIFSHIQWNMKSVFTQVEMPLPGYEWVEVTQLQEKYPLPTAFRLFKEELKKRVLE